MFNQVKSLLENRTCNGLSIPSDYALEAGAAATLGLTGENETADTALYAAIERKDWAEAERIYKEVFRPHLKAFAEQVVFRSLNTVNTAA